MAVLKSPPAVAIFSPISEQKEPSSIRALQVFPGHPRLGAELAASGGRALHPPGWASSCQRRGRDARTEFRHKRTNSELKRYLKLLKFKNFATCILPHKFGSNFLLVKQKITTKFIKTEYLTAFSEL